MKSKTTVFGIMPSRMSLEQAVEELESGGFNKNDVSALLPDKQETKDFAHEKHTKAPEGATAGAGTGAVVGGTLGWLVGMGSLAIPGLGPFIAAGPIMGALAGVGAGGAIGGIGGALIGMGLPEFEAKRYEDKVKDGGILISVHSHSNEETKLAKEILERNGAKDLATSGDSKAPKESTEEPVAEWAPEDNPFRENVLQRSGTTPGAPLSKPVYGPESDARIHQNRGHTTRF